MDTGLPTPADDNGSRQNARDRRLVTTRRLLIGGAPLIVSLASKPALAWPQCSISHVLSGNMSNDAQINPTETCALPPNCWYSAATGSPGWQVTALGYQHGGGGQSGGYSPSAKFSTTFGIAGSRPPNGSKGWYVGSNDSLKSALSSSSSNLPKVYYFNGTTSFQITATAGSYAFVTQAVCALLNASAFYADGHFLYNSTNIPASEVLGWINMCFGSGSTLTSNGTNTHITACCTNCNDTLSGSRGTGDCSDPDGPI